MKTKHRYVSAVIIWKNESVNAAKRYLLVTVCLLLTKFSLANTPHIYALHINGINTSQTEARKNYIALQNVAQIDSNMVIFNVIWNPTGDDAGKTTLSNLNDVIRQKAQEQQAIMTLDDFTDFYISQYPLVYPPAIYHRGTPEYAKLQKEIPDLYYQELNKIAGPNFSKIIDEFHNIVPPPFEDVVKLLNENPNTHNNMNDYPKTINLGKSPLFKNMKGLANKSVTLDYSKSLDDILLISHSQGNLYANSLHDYLIRNEKLSPQHIAIYGIATPASENRGSWIADLFKDDPSYCSCINSYITSSNDFVINSVRQLFTLPVYKPVLPANITIPFTKSVDWGNGHNLIDVYLKESEAKSQISMMINIELGVFVEMKLENLSDNNFRFGGFGGYGVVMGPGGEYICVDGICELHIQYVRFSDGTRILFASNEYYFAGKYTVLSPFVDTGVNPVLHIYFNKDLSTSSMWFKGIRCVDDSVPCGGGYYAEYSPAITNYLNALDPGRDYYSYFSPDAFYNGRFINGWTYLR